MLKDIVGAFKEAVDEVAEEVKGAVDDVADEIVRESKEAELDEITVYEVEGTVERISQLSYDGSAYTAIVLKGNSTIFTGKNYIDSRYSGKGGIDAQVTEAGDRVKFEYRPIKQSCYHDSESFLRVKFDLKSFCNLTIGCKHDGDVIGAEQGEASKEPLSCKFITEVREDV